MPVDRRPVRFEALRIPSGPGARRSGVRTRPHHLHESKGNTVMASQSFASQMNLYTVLVNTLKQYLPEA